MKELMIKVPVSQKHVSQKHFCTNRSGTKYCGIIELIDNDFFVCKHLADPKDPFRTTGTVITHVFEEFKNRVKTKSYGK